MIIRQTLFLLYLIKISHWFLLVMPIIVLFYEDNGLSMGEITIIQAAYSVSIMLFEIPTGYLADILGRRYAIIAGTILGFTGFLIYCFSSGFREFMLAEIILGFGQSMISGADSALLYDFLANKGRSDEYHKYEGRITSAGNFAEAIAGTIGGLLAIRSLRTPFYFQAAVAGLGIPAAWLLREPPRASKTFRPGIRDILYIVNHALFRDKYLRITILLSAVAGTATLTMAWFVQPYLKMTRVPLPLFGILWSFLNLTTGLASMFSHQIEKNTSPAASLVVSILWLPATYLLLGCINAAAAISLIFLFYFSRGFITPLLKRYIHKGTSSDRRATVLSVRNLMIRALFTAIGPLLGFITDQAGLQIAFLTGGLLFMVVLTILLFFVLRIIRTNKQQ